MTADRIDVGRLSKAKTALLGKVFSAEVRGGRFQSKSKLADALVAEGLLVRSAENLRDRLGAYTHEWLDLTQLGRMVFCMNCDDEPEEE